MSCDISTQGMPNMIGREGLKSVRSTYGCRRANRYAPSPMRAPEIRPEATHRVKSLREGRAGHPAIHPMPKRNAPTIARVTSTTLRSLLSIKVVPNHEHSESVKAIAERTLHDRSWVM